MKRFGEYNLDYFINKDSQSKYEELYVNNLALEDKLLKLITLNPGFMVKHNTVEQDFIKSKYAIAKEVISEKTSKKLPIELFTTSFNTKPHTKHITNGYIHPDISDFLSLLHLNLLFKYLNKIYEPGVRLHIGININFFIKFNMIDESTGEELISILGRMNDIARDMIHSDTTNDYIRLYDIKNEIESFRKQFYLTMEDEKLNIIQQDTEMKRIEEGSRYYLENVIDITKFPDEEAAHHFSSYHLLNGAAYIKAIEKSPNTKEGIFKNFDKKILAETRFENGSSIDRWKKSIYIPFLPGAKTFSYNKLHLRKKNGLWEQINYEDVVKNKNKPVFIKGFSYPMFFIEKD